MFSQGVRRKQNALLLMDVCRRCVVDGCGCNNGGSEGGGSASGMAVVVMMVLVVVEAVMGMLVLVLVAQ
jgi:hypothetical protein